MLIFYGVYRKNSWQITNKLIGKESYLVIHAKTEQDARVKLNRIVAEYNPRIYL